MLNEISAIILSSVIRLFITLMVSWSYIKTRSKFAFYFGLFFLFYSIHGSFRIFNIVSGDPFWYFLHILFLTLGTVAMLYGLENFNVRWIKRYRVAPIALFLALGISYYDAYVVGPQSAEMDNIFARIITLGFSGTGLLMAGHYFYVGGKRFLSSGRNIMALGFTLEGLLHFAAILMIPIGYIALAFILGLVFTLVIGIGLYLTLIKEKEFSKKTIK